MFESYSEEQYGAAKPARRGGQGQGRTPFEAAGGSFTDSTSSFTPVPIPADGAGGYSEGGLAALEDGGW